MSSGFINPSAGGLLRGNNLSDLANAQIALDNLINNATVTGATFANSAVNGIRLFNTADQVTNFERLDILWSANAANIRTTQGGTGSARNLIFSTGNGQGLNMEGSTTGYFWLKVPGTGAANALGFRLSASGAFSASSGTSIFAQIAPTYNQSGTAAATDLLVNRTETVVGSGTQALLDLQVGGISKFRVHSSGQVDALSGASYLRFGVIQRTANATLSNSRQISTNEGAGARIDLTLPPAVVGLAFSFITQNANGIRVKPDAGDTIRIFGAVTMPGGHVEALAAGYALDLVAINSTEWVAKNQLGGWTVV